MIKHIFTTLFLFALLCSNTISSAQVMQTDSSLISGFPSIPYLPEPLILNEGTKNTPVMNEAQWEQKREWIKQQYQHWVSGSVPPAPKTFKSKVVSETTEGGVTLRTVELYFGPNDKAKMTVELMIPHMTKKLPVFMTQWNHKAWAQIAVRRGYIGCIYAGADGTDDSRNYGDIFPGFDFATLMKRAWGGSRVVDYLVTLQEVDTARIAITGHSRNGKQSLMAAAFDTRIKAVVSSSGGTGAESTFRFSDERFNSESVEEITRNFPYWFVSRLRMFTGREDKLPVDQNLLMSLVAPRALMMVSAISEGQGNPWGIEQSYQSVKKVYHFKHADSNLAILLRPGRHQHSAREVEDYIDFFDYVFGRSKISPANKLYADYSFDNWKRISGESADPKTVFKKINYTFKSAVNIQPFRSKQDSVRAQIRWLLGDEPAGVMISKKLSPILTRNRAYPDDYLAEVIGEPALPADMAKMEIGPYSPLGDDLWGTIYFPSTATTKDSVSKKLPLVIFLHEYAYATGYHRRSVSAIHHFTEKGFAVLAFDQVGFGTRVEESRHFYDRYPHWSLMGKMVADTRSIIHDARTRMPFIDSSNIFLTGYSLGGTVALLTAALDSTVKGVMVASALSSLKDNKSGAEGILHYSYLSGLIPRLGFFLHHEDVLAFDFDDILSCIAPRSLLIIAPEQDRVHPIASVSKIISEAKAKSVNRANQAPAWLTFQHPDGYNRFTDSLQQNMADWLITQKRQL